MRQPAMLMMLAVLVGAAVAAEPRAANSAEPPLKQPLGMKYPETERVDHVDVYHGVKVADPYRWLEDDVRDSEDVADWVKAQNEVTFGYLEQIPERPYINKLLTKLWNYEKFNSPFKAGGRYYYDRVGSPQSRFAATCPESRFIRCAPGSKRT